MTPDLMRKIDAWVGPVICFVLSIRRMILEKFMPRKKGPLNKVKRILMVKPAEMGSTILMYSMLKRAQKLWPGVEIHFLVFSENVAAVDMLGLIPQDNIHKLRTNNLKNFVCDSLVNLFKVRKLKFDLAMDLEFFSRASAVLAELSGASSTCGFSRFTMEGLYRGNLLTHPVQYNPHIHTAQTFYSMIEAVRQPAGQIPLVKTEVPGIDRLQTPEFFAGEDEKKEVRNLLQQANDKSKKVDKLIIINANSSELVPLRRWPLQNYIELGRKLVKQYNAIIVLTGVASEKAESEEVSQNIGSENVANLVGKTTLRQLLVLYSLCDLMITNDSGPSHFASVTDLPVVTLFGPETPRLYSALGKNRIALTAGLACSPCVSSYNHRASPCNDNICMKKISVEQVMTASNRLLSNR
jgi:ADP-heptose:LPS heptosyltransferase